MDKREIKTFLDSFANRLDRTMVIIDYGNVEKWKRSLTWKVGIRELGHLIKNFSQGDKSLRRFYYGSDYGRKENSKNLTGWSKAILQKAQMNNFEIVTKRVKYIHDNQNSSGFQKKCDLDVEMATDLVEKRDAYDTVILFSGDGDLMYAMRYLTRAYRKKCFVFGVRDHVGREMFDAKKDGIVQRVLFVEDFEYRLKDAYFRH